MDRQILKIRDIVSGWLRSACGLAVGPEAMAAIFFRSRSRARHRLCRCPLASSFACHNLIGLSGPRPKSAVVSNATGCIVISHILFCDVNAPSVSSSASHGPPPASSWASRLPVRPRGPNPMASSYNSGLTARPRPTRSSTPSAAPMTTSRWVRLGCGLWGVGVLVQELSSGAVPFVAETPMGMYQIVLSGSVRVPVGFSSWLAYLARRLLEASPLWRLGQMAGGTRGWTGRGFRHGLVVA